MGHPTYYHLNTLPRLHTVVWCCPPKPDGTLGDAVRPALVRETQKDPSTGRGAVRISYGTTRLDQVNKSSVDLIIQNNERLNTLGLPQAVRFDLGLFNWLPWAAEFFKPPEHDFGMVAGVLIETEKGRLRLALKRRGIITAL